MAGLLSALETERDASLLARHRAGDPAAFGELYELHYDRLLRHLRQRVRDWHVAEEIAQDTFVRAYGAAAHLKDGNRFYPWLSVIAQRLAIDWFRRNGRVSPVAEFDQELGEEAPADEGVIAACEAEAVEAAMGRVRERHRQVLRWQNEGLSYEDIAARLNAPLTTVPPLLFRARQALRREYLALMEAERIAAVPVLGAVVAWSRRWRARGLTVASYVPEPAVLTAQFAGALVAVSAAFGALASADTTAVDLTVGAVLQDSQGMSLVGGAEGGSDATVTDSQSEVQAPPRRGEPLVQKAVPYLRVDNHEHDRGKDQARRDAAYFVEVGPAWLALDPQSDAERTSDLVNESGFPDGRGTMEGGTS